MENPIDLESRRLLNYTQSVRESLVRSLIQDGKMPEDNEDRQILLKALDGIDKQEISKAKIKVDDKNANNLANVNDMIANMLINVNSNNKQPRQKLPEVPSDVLDVVVIPGETEVGVHPITYEQMMNPK